MKLGRQRTFKATIIRTGDSAYYSRLTNLYSSNLAFHFKMDDTTGVTCIDSIAGANGTHHNTAGVLDGVMLNQSGYSSERATQYDGITGYTVISSASLKNLIDTQEFTAMGIAWPTNAEVWTSGDTYGRFVNIKRDANNYVRIGRYGKLGKIAFDTKMGGIQKIEVYTIGLDTEPFHWVYTVSATGDLVRVYVNGVPISSGMGGLGVWSAGATASHLSAELIDPISNKWEGYQQHISFFDKALSSTEIANATADFFSSSVIGSDNSISVDGNYNGFPGMTEV